MRLTTLSPNMRCLFMILFGICTVHQAVAQLPPVFNPTTATRSEPMVTQFLAPTRIVWKDGQIKNAQELLKLGNGQADLSGSDLCIIKNRDSLQSSILFDFGKEIQGGIQIVTDQSAGGKPIRVRLRFGESVSEAMSTVEPVKNATNDHAMRDFVVELPWLGKLEVGNTGFRFVRIDLLDKNAELKLKEVSAMFRYRDIPYLGSFNSSDTLLNKLWMTGAYTVHLNMQDYLLDGVKRDRLVWVGDLHPETSTIAAVFGENEVVEKSLDQARETTPLPQYMASMVSYSMWWIIIQRDWYMATGNLAYLKKQSTYIKDLLNQLCTKIDANNSEALDGGTRFLDWPSSRDKKAIHAGLQGMLKLTMEAGAELSRTLNDETTAKACELVASRLAKNVPDPGTSKQAAAMLGLSGLISPQKANKIISAGGVKDYSAFFGYYMLQVQAKAGNYKGAMKAIKDYWGAMLKLGATTFWEDFNIDWVKNAGRIDELVPEGKVDIHSAYGDYCYKGFRLSLCHGWSAGPTPWLTKNVLGVKIMEPGCRVLKIEPHLGNLTYANGSFPTPFGVVYIWNKRLKNGRISTKVKGPKEVKIIVAK